MGATRYALQCDCSAICWVTQSDAGGKVLCPECKSETDVPSYSKLRVLPSVDSSPIGRAEYRVRNGDQPFAGQCQLCDIARAEIVFPIRIDYVPADEMASSGGESEVRSSVLPCGFCYPCSKDFKRSLRTGRVRQISGLVLRSFWFLLATVISIALFFVSSKLCAAFTVLVVCSLYFHLMRKNLNPALAKHIAMLCEIDDLKKDFYFVQLTKLKHTKP